MFLRIYNPEVFQGNLKRKHYFEGWYFKHVTGQPYYVFSFIPGISLTDKDPHAFIQVMNGFTGNSQYIRYSVDDFKWDKRKLNLKVGNSVFTDNGITLDIKQDDIELTGQINYSKVIKYPKSLLSPGIMGWYSYVPFMECYHGIVSVSHDLSGSISTSGFVVDFKGGKGYIEKDWGTSFPEAWIWIQSNSFGTNNISFSFSIAKIPWLGSSFIGFIGFIFSDGKFHLFSTYNKSKVTELNILDNSIEILVRNNKYILSINVIKNSFGDLIAPVSGSMSRKLKESVDSVLHLEMFDANYNRLFESTGNNVGLEIMEPEVLKV